jgi:hypothetical protein
MVPGLGVRPVERPVVLLSVLVLPDGGPTPPRRLAPSGSAITKQFVGVEARPVVLDVAPDPIDRGQDVRQTFTVVAHKATASARTRSRMRAFSPPGVATST